MQVRSLVFSITFFALVIAGSAQAAVILELGDTTLLNGGFVGRSITAKGTNGEVIAGFDGIKIENAHQVWGLGDAQTLRTGSFPGFGWNAAWVAYDTHLLVSSNAIVGSVGAVLTETNSKGTTGTLGLPTEFGLSAPSGFGTLKSSDGTDGFRLLPELQTSSVPFLYVVGTSPSALQLDVSVAFTLDGYNLSEVFTDFSVDPFGIAPSAPDVGLAVYELGGIATVNMGASGTSPFTWSVAPPTFTPNLGVFPNGPPLGTATYSIDPATGYFAFVSFGATRGLYEFVGTVSNAVGSDTFKISVQYGMPEPGTLTLLGLAVVGLVHECPPPILNFGDSTQSGTSTHKMRN